MINLDIHAEIYKEARGMPIEFKRKLEWTRPATRGEHVVAIQEALRDRGFDVVGRPDGIFGGNTAAAVRQFQAARGLEVTGSVDARTWIALIPPVEDGTTATDPLAELRELHAYRDGVSWRLTPRGIEVAGEVPVSRGRLVTVPAIWESYQAPIVEMSVRYDVPAELILATICTESRGNRFAVREEPGYESDEETPNKVSPGLMQTLISTARGTLAGADDVDVAAIDREWLFEAANAIRAGTAYIARQGPQTNLDPPKVACAYNAGGVYYNSGAANRWRMRQYPIGTGEHADRFVMWFNDVFRMFAEGIAEVPAVSFSARMRAD